jgi:hypothetical protein
VLPYKTNARNYIQPSSSVSIDKDEIAAFSQSQLSVPKIVNTKPLNFNSKKQSRKGQPGQVKKIKPATPSKKPELQTVFSES